MVDFELGENVYIPALWSVVDSEDSSAFAIWTPVISFVVSTMLGIDESKGPGNKLSDPLGYSTIAERVVYEAYPVDGDAPDRIGRAELAIPHFREAIKVNTASALQSVTTLFSWRSKDSPYLEPLVLESEGMAHAKLDLYLRPPKYYELSLAAAPTKRSVVKRFLPVAEDDEAGVSSKAATGSGAYITSGEGKRRRLFTAAPMTAVEV